MSGWRIGFAVTSPELVDAIGKLINTSASCSPPLAQRAAQAALESDAGTRDEYMERFRRKVVRLCDGLARVEGFRATRPAGTFYVFPDVRAACKVMRPVYDATGHVDGRVSIEVSPGLAHDTDATVAEAADLWKTVDQPNLMIKIPGTVEGGPAITETLAAGISVNVTLIFGLDQYRNVMDAHMAGLEKARENGHDLSTIHSVASFFVSRVDTEIDRRLDESGADASLKGRAGVANARLAYQAYEETLASDRWAALEAAGARRQRPLWASTGVKNPDYKDTLYVDDLIVEDTVNTMPEKTMHAEADHGDPKPDQVRPFYGEAAATMKALADVGIDYDDVIEVLIKEGVDKFIKAWGELLDSVDEALAAAQ